MGGNRMKQPRQLIQLFVVAIGPLAGILANTPIVATLIPVVEAWCQRRGLPAIARVAAPLHRHHSGGHPSL